MRSDLRLDFVARSLALTGLAVLGLSAALLDRWTSALPAVRAPEIGLTSPTVQIALTLPEPAAPGIQPASADTRRLAQPKPPPVTDAAKQDTAVAEVSPLPAEEPALSAPGELPAPVQSRPVENAFVAWSTLPAAVDTWQPMATSAAAAPTERSDEGFVSGVLKRTGSSVSTSLGKASNGVLGAVRVVGDAVKRAF